MGQYLLAVHHDYDAPQPSTEEMEKVYGQVDEFNQTLIDSGSWVFGGGLETDSDAKVVDAVAGAPVTTDGPYTETKEALGGFWIIEAADDATALDWAAKASAACLGPVEVRAFQAEPDA